MAPWLADRMWLQVLLASLYLLGFVIAGRWTAANTSAREEGPVLRPVLITVMALLGGIVLPLVAVPAAFCWVVARLLDGGN